MQMCQPKQRRATALACWRNSSWQADLLGQLLEEVPQRQRGRVRLPEALRPGHDLQLGPRMAKLRKQKGDRLRQGGSG